MLKKYLLLFFLLMNFSSNIFAEYTTDKWKEKKKLREGGWAVAYGREITETDLIEATIIAVTAPEALGEWVNEIINESVSQMTESVTEVFPNYLQEEAKSFALQILRELLRTRSVNFSLKDFPKLEFKAGVAKYMGRNLLYGHTISTTHAWQPYIAIRLKYPKPPNPSYSGDFFTQIDQMLTIHEGCFVKQPMNPDIYWIENQEKRRIPNPDVAYRLFGNYTYIENIFVKDIPTGNPISENSCLFKHPSRNSVYFLDGNVKRWIVNLDSSNLYRFDLTKLQIRTDIYMPDGEPIIIGGIPIPIPEAIQTNVVIAPNHSANVKASQTIVLMNGFHACQGCSFSTSIGN